MNKPEYPASITAIFLVFFHIGAFSFGGGLSGWVFREVVVIHRWIDEDEFFSGMALGQILPGANITNLSIFIGNKLKGPLGAAAALAGLLAVPFFAVIALASVYSILKTMPAVEAALDGMAAAAIGLILVIALKGARRALRRPEAIAAFAVTFVLVGLLHWSLLTVVLNVGPLSVLAAWFRRRANA